MTGKTLSFFSVSQNSGVNLCDVKNLPGEERRLEGRKEEFRPCEGRNVFFRPMSHTELTIWTNQFYQTLPQYCSFSLTTKLFFDWAKYRGIQFQFTSHFPIRSILPLRVTLANPDDCDKLCVSGKRAGPA